MTKPDYVRQIDWQRRRERAFAAIGLALGIAVGIAAALALGGCGETRYADGHISDAQLRAMTADYLSTLHTASGQ